MAHAIMIGCDCKKGVPSFEFTGCPLVLKVLRRLAHIEVVRARDARLKEIAEGPCSVPATTTTLLPTSKAIEAAPQKAAPQKAPTQPTSKALEVVPLAAINPKDSMGSSAVESKQGSGSGSKGSDPRKR
ncbi:hypothetical protein NE237_025520 [Protea cynaroides]|uniref:Uncharacterized protein n=1 Tax=Protea cynaroides TaxID=273540 RepID=A0A9Q0H3B1_9MAGN|nr:hypothetical protein NE237_025520 [Protea cynaroides]